VAQQGDGVKHLSKGTWALFAFLGALFLATIYGFWFAIEKGVIPHISIHGWIAMSIGILFSLLIGCGLMWLSFYSARAGFDDRADPGRMTARNDRPAD
jgi:hypothetical protein